jgi:hypothetical protein
MSVEECRFNSVTWQTVLLTSSLALHMLYEVMEKKLMEPNNMQQREFFRCAVSIEPDAPVAA